MNINIFGQRRIEELFESVESTIQSKVNTVHENILLEQDINSLADEISSSAKLKTEFMLNTSDIENKTEIEPIPVQQLPLEVRMFAKKSFYDCAVVYYTLKFKGNQDLLQYQPRTYTIWTYQVEVGSGSIKFCISTNYANENLSEDIKKDVRNKARDIIKHIEDTAKLVIQECEEFNNTIPSRCLQLLEKRKNDIIKRKNQEDDLNPFK